VKHKSTSKTIVKSKQNVSGSRNWINACFSLMDKVKILSKTKKWKREDLYRV